MNKKRIIIIIAAVFLISLVWPRPAGASLGPRLLLTHDYNKTSPFCLNCHDINLIAKLPAASLPTLDATCITCHDIHRFVPDDLNHRSRGRPNIGTASKFTAYKINIYSRYSQNGHRLGANADTSLANQPVPRPVLSPISNPRTPRQINTWRYWRTAGDQITPSIIPRPAFDSVITCESCHSPHTINTAAASSSSLSGAVVTTDTSQEITLCLSCHPKYASNNNGGPNHNHPDRFCLDCHGNDANSNDSRDFPHSGGTNLLSDFKDALCIRCHISESIP